MEEVFPNNLRHRVRIISLESVENENISNYLKDITSRWKYLKETQPFQNKYLYIIPFNNVFNPEFRSNSNNIECDKLMVVFSYMLHHYITYFKEIAKFYEDSPTSKREFYILSGYSLPTFKEVFTKVYSTNKWLGKTNNFNKFCKNLDYVTTYFYPDKFIYDFIPVTVFEENNIKKTTYQYLNDWMDIRKKKQDILCLNGLIKHNINYNTYLEAIIGFLLDN
jgi:hypothetical protein